MIDWTPEAAEKGGYDHFMLKEIHEQPEALRQCIAGRVTRDGRIRLEELDRPRRARSAPSTRVELVACGTRLLRRRSSGAAAIQDWTGLPARATVGSEFRYSPPPLDGNTLVIAVTQSGETADTIAPTRLAREQGCPIIAVTNTVGSAITREADAVLFLQAGPEIAVAASKTFVDPGHDAGDPGGRDRQGARHAATRRRAGARPTRSAPCRRPRSGALDATASGAPALARRYVNSRGFMFVGRGYTYPTALEGALKLKEVSYVHAEGYAAGELKHGPISLLDAECPLVAVATRSTVYDKLISNVMEGRARDARVIAVATEGDPQIERYADDVWWVPDTHEALSPVLGDHPAPAVRLPRRRRPGHGRRPAAEPREVGHGRVGDRDRVAAPPASRVPTGTTELGIDIIKVDRIRGSIERFGERFSKRVLTAGEQRYVRDRPETFAGRWAAKEAVSKVLGLGVRGIGWRDIEIERLPTGQPVGAPPRPRRGARRAARHGPDRRLDQPRVGLRGRDRVRHPDGRRPLRLPARHRGAPRRPRAADPRPDGAAPRAPRGQRRLGGSRRTWRTRS